MSQSTVAERYARAILELGDEAGQLPQVTEQIRVVADAFAESEELRDITANPAVDGASRDAMLKDLGARLGLSPVAMNAVRLMARRGRLSALPEVATVLATLADQKAGVLRATVTSAEPLSEGYYQQLSSELEKRTSRKILLERRQDPTLIAGVVTRIGDHTIDGSLKGRLAALERQLLASN
ncbi:MAG TPA: ATP synthase F1 subunit delta [Polyangiaceae bacterium]|nr:ATP synthase F1 subunit delta [Polyangiaceae bacterium]